MYFEMLDLISLEKKKKYLQYPLSKNLSKISIWICIFFDKLAWTEIRNFKIKRQKFWSGPEHGLQWCILSFITVSTFLAQEIVYRTQLTLSIIIFSDIVCPHVLRLNCKWMQSKAELLRKGINFLIHLFARAILLLNKL